MIKKLNIVFIFLIASLLSQAKLPPKSGVNGKGFRFGFGPAVGFYKINTNHAQAPSRRMSALIGFKKEVRCDNQHKVFFLFGADYFFHGVNFKSYYFDQDTLQLYDKSFAYDYSLFMQEIQIPLQAKFSFNRESNNLFSPYVMIGYHLRFLLPANVRVSNEGNQVSKKDENLKFRNKLFVEQMNSCISLTAGWQKNTINNSKSGFFIELNYRYGFSQYYFKTNYAANSLFMNSSHLVLQLGLKF
jgi:hypothetical protein